MSAGNPELGSAHIGDPTAIVSTFKVLLVQPTTITSRNGEVVDFEIEFDLDSRAVLNGPFILSFLLEHAVELHLIMDINGVTADWIYAPGPERVVQHVLERAGIEGTNRLTLSVYQGSMRFANLVLWHLVSLY
jgi:hypothetical protein